MEEKNNAGGNSEKLREFSNIIKGVFIFFMVTSGFNCITKLATNLTMGHTSLGIVMFICELANIYFIYVILQKKYWGLIAFFGMLLLQIPLNILLKCPDMDAIYISTFSRILVFSIILLIPKNGITGWSILFGKDKHLIKTNKSSINTMFRILFILFWGFGMVSCSNQMKNEDVQDSQSANQQNLFVKYNNFGVSFDYPDDYKLEEKVLEEGRYIKVYLDKEDDTTFHTIEIEWSVNPQKYDPIAGRKVVKDALMSVYGGNVRVIRNYENILGDEKVYWTDYVIDQYVGKLFLKSGITRIDDYVFVIQKISNIDIDNEDANKIFNSIRLTKK